MRELKIFPAAKKKSRAAEIDELMQFLKPGRELGIMVRRHLEELPEKYVVLVVTTHKNYALLGEQLIKYFLEKQVAGIFVTTNRPAANLIEVLQRDKLNVGSVFFIDAVSRKSSEEKAGGKNVIYIDSPENLTELDSAIGECTEKLQSKNRFFVLDSLSTLLVYSPQRTLEKFTHSLSGKMRAAQFKVVFTLVSKKAETIGTLGQFCDKVIEI